MEYSDLIYIFLDGEATENERTLLFSALATDNALQIEFQDAFRMHTSVQKEIETTTPPPILTNELFAKAGFAQISQEQPKKKAAWLLMLLLLLKNWAIPIVSAVGGAILATIVLQWNNNVLPTYQSTVPTNQVSIAAQSPNNTSLITTQKRNTAIPISSSYHITPEMQPEEHSLGDGNYTKNISPTANLPFTLTMPQQPMMNNILSPPAFNFSSVVSELSDISVQISGHNGLGQHGDSPSSSLNNMSVSVCSYLALNHLLGAQIGQESFPIYSATGDFEKNASVFWVGALYRYEMDAISELGNIQPFIQAVAAGTRSGPLGKATAGILWQPDSRVVLSLGLEGTALVYQYQSASYGTQKLGLNYGVSVKF
jgi:hypothetical protein